MDAPFGSKPKDELPPAVALTLLAGMLLWCVYGATAFIVGGFSTQACLAHGYPAARLSWSLTAFCTNQTESVPLRTLEP